MAASSPQPRPPLPIGLRAHVESRMAVEGLFSFGGLPHAGRGSAPRPMEPWSLDDLRASAERSTQGLRQTVPDAMWIVFLNRRNAAPIDHGLRVPKEHLWWVVSPADQVLLSDGATHHYTTVGQVDRSEQTLSFLDPWPEQFLLNYGLNVLGIAARNLTIGRSEFERVAVGVLTLHTPELIDAYFASFPEQGASVEQRLRAGHSLLAPGPEHLAGCAVDHFFEAARLADAAGDGATALDAVAYAWVAARCALAAATHAGDTGVAESMARMAELASRRAARAELLARLTPAALCRLANSAGRMGDTALLEAATAAALAVDSNHSEAYRLRAMAHVRSDPPAAETDLRQALALNATEAASLQAELVRLQNPKFGGPVLHRLERANRQRADILRILAAATTNQGDGDGALAAVRELCNCAPELPDSWRRRLACEQAWGDKVSLREAAQAIAMRSDMPPDLSSEAQAVLNGAARSQ